MRLHTYLKEYIASTSRYEEMIYVLRQFQQDRKYAFNTRHCVCLVPENCRVLGFAFVLRQNKNEITQVIRSTLYQVLGCAVGLRQLAEWRSCALIVNPVPHESCFLNQNPIIGSSTRHYINFARIICLCDRLN